MEEKGILLLSIVRLLIDSMLFVYRQGVLIQVKNRDNLNGILHAANEMAEQCTREGSSFFCLGHIESDWPVQKRHANYKEFLK